MPLFFLPYFYSQLVICSLAGVWTEAAPATGE